MSGWKLVEAEVLRTSSASVGAAAAPAPGGEGGGEGAAASYQADQRRPPANNRFGARTSGGRGGYRDGSGGFRRYGRGYYNQQPQPQQGGRYNYQGVFIPDTPETRAYNVAIAMQQIEYLFSLDNLCRDTYLRSFMDEAGFVPLAFLMQAFPGIAASGADYYDLLAALIASASASASAAEGEGGSRQLLEVDEANDLVRLRDGWATWLMPNPSGGRGLPRYIKQQQQQPEYPANAAPSAASETEEGNSDMAAEAR